MSEFKLTVKEIHDNWKIFREIINERFPVMRAQALNRMYDELEERATMAPASSFDYFHNAIPGGYVDHVLRVYNFTLKQYDLWKECGFKFAFSKEELEFAALHHDLGKLGLPGDGNEHYVPNDSEWHRKNQGKIYKSNPNKPFMTTADMSFYLLNHYQIPYSVNEMLGIKLTDGMFDESNKQYLAGFSLESKLRNTMPYILHHADIMAFRFEFERWNHYANKFRYSGQDAIPDPVKENGTKKPGKVLSEESIKATDAMDAFKTLFPDD